MTTKVGMWNVWLLQGLFQVSLSSVSIYTEMFSTINNFLGSQASQKKAILSVPQGFRFIIGLNTSTFGNDNLSKMTLAHRTTRHARAAPLDSLFLHDWSLCIKMNFAHDIMVIPRTLNDLYEVTGYTIFKYLSLSTEINCSSVWKQSLLCTLFLTNDY